MQALVDAIDQQCGDGPRPVVSACWQDEAYLDVPPGLLERLASMSDLTIACSGRPPLPHGADHVLVEPEEELAAEWSLVALTPSGGMALIAHEIGSSLPAATVEDGRAFRYDTTDDPQVVLSHARRLHREFGARMDPDASARLGAAIAAMPDGPTDGHQLDMLTAPVATAIVLADDDRQRETTGPDGTGGLVGLAQWLSDAGPRTPSLGMVVVRSDHGTLTSHLRARASNVVRTGDIVVDVPPDAAMMVLPGLVGSALQTRANEIRTLLSRELAGGQVDTCALDVPAEHARHDLVGNLGRALADLRHHAAAPA